MSLRKRLVQKIEGIIKSKIECCVCGYKAHSFQDHGLIARKNAKCPKCQSLERTRMLWHFMVNELNIKNKKIDFLHIAPDKGISEQLLKLSNVTYTAGDYFAEGYSYKGNVMHLDIREMPFEDNSFDMVLCEHVLEHIEEDHKAMKEVLRVLRSGGMAILQVPIDYSKAKTYEDFSITSPEERIKHFGQFDHVRQYGLDYKDRLSNAGFVVEIIDYSAKVGKSVAVKNAFMLRDDLYLCTKP
jgi:predicted SAM-dependent methyltransferase